MRYIDANVILHAAVVQEPREHALAAAFIEALREGRHEAFLTEPVIAEVAVNLRTARLGRQSHEWIGRFLRDVIALPGIRLADKAIWPRALQLFAIHRVDLADAHQVALMERDGEGEIISFDTDFDRIPGVKRTEPFDKLRTEP
jgi:predicted nucleic acid-binding protein